MSLAFLSIFSIERVAKYFKNFGAAIFVSARWQLVATLLIFDHPKSKDHR